MTEIPTETWRVKFSRFGVTLVTRYVGPFGWRLEVRWGVIEGDLSWDSE